MSAPRNRLGDDEVRAIVGRWIESIVIGLELCPFAAEPWRAGGVRIAVSSAKAGEEAVKDALDAAFTLIENDDIATTLVVFPDAHDLADFEALLDVAETVEHILGEAGGDGVLQVATFHPKYRFGDEPDPDALAHYTSRAPFPIVQLLREDDVARAADEHPHLERLSHDNAVRIEALGRAQVVALHAALHKLH